MGIQVADKTKWISKSKENMTWSEKDTIFFLFKVGVTEKVHLHLHATFWICDSFFRVRIIEDLKGGMQALVWGRTKGLKREIHIIWLHTVTATILTGKKYSLTN